MVRQRSLGSDIAVRLLRAGDDMSDYVRDSGADAAQDASSPPPSSSPSPGGGDFSYPWAAAPDIIRSHQKDVYFQSVLLSRLESVIRSLYGARTAHTWNAEARTFTELLYLGLTTFVGNRTLGEEYTDIVQVDDATHALPSIFKRSGYILSSVLLPYILSRFLPAFRRRLRAKLDASLRKLQRRRASSPTRSGGPHHQSHVQEYILKHLDTITSPAPVYALSLAVFYFSGAYYKLSKRLFGLRYVFTRRLTAADRRAGYEVLGILLVLQMLVQSFLHVQDTVAAVRASSVAPNAGAAVIDGGVEIGTGGAAAASDFDADDDDAIAAPLLFESPHAIDPAAQRDHLARITHTRAGARARYDLADERVMRWIGGPQQRKCTLCLEPMKDPAATTCGHVFCWSCVTEWLREQPMCPLCRQSARSQHVLPLRG